MILFSLTEMALEMSLAVTWWTCKKTYQITSYGVKYLYEYYNTPVTDNVLYLKNCDCKSYCECV